MAARIQSFFAELRRRHVIRTTGVYIVAIWLLSQGIADLFPAFGLPDWTIRAAVVLGILGIPVVAILAWVFDITPKGVERDAGFGYDDTLITTDLVGGTLSPPVSLVATWVDESDEPRRRRFAHPFVIGREGDIALLDKRVSRRHAQVFYADGAWRVRDLDSANGTFMDGEPVAEAALPADGFLRFHRRGPTLRLQIDQEDDDTTVSDH